MMGGQLPYNPPVSVILGSAHLARRLTTERVGLLANPASVDGTLCHVADLVTALPGVTLAALFGPQHGFRSDVQDNMVETDHARHPVLNVPVYSLYGETREPTAAMLEELDLSSTAVTDKGIASLSGLRQLKRLWLTNTMVSDEGLQHLEPLKQLETLELSGTDVSDDAVKLLRAKLPKLKDQ